MNLHSMLLAREADGRPIQVAMIGAGKFASMYLSQAVRTAGTHIAGVCDLDPKRARAALLNTGWPEDRLNAASIDEAMRTRAVYLTDDADSLISADGIEVAMPPAIRPREFVTRWRA